MNEIMETTQGANDMKIVKLKNGSEEVETAVKVVMLSLRKLIQEGQIVVVLEIVSLCRDDGHTPWGGTGDVLKRLSLAEQNMDGQWKVHQTTKNIVLSAAEGEGVDLKIGDPIA
jgi:hypothetical protein